MKVISYSILVSLIFSASAYAGVYKYRDAHGNIIYSDAPHNGSEELDSSELPSVSMPNLQSRIDAIERQNRGLSGDDQATDEPVKYELAITSPGSEETLHNGVANISYSASPALQPGHSFNVYQDGSALKTNTKQTSVSLQEVYRGAHPVKVDIVDKNNKVLATTELTYYMQRPSI